jgi:hypothetical protein
VAIVCMFLCGAPVIQCSTMQRIVALLVTEAELFAAATDKHAQAMRNTKRIVESLGLHVQLPMILESDNKGAVSRPNEQLQCGRENSACGNKTV